MWTVFAKPREEGRQASLGRICGSTYHALVGPGCTDGWRDAGRVAIGFGLQRYSSPAHLGLDCWYLSYLVPPIGSSSG